MQLEAGTMTRLVTATLIALCWTVGGGEGQASGNRGVAAVKVTLPPVAAFTDKETSCLEQKQVFYSGDGKCYELRHRGPCPSGQWLVLDLAEAVNGTGALRPVCRDTPCSSNLAVYWPADGKCHKVTERAKLCPHAGTELLTDPFGEGECACVRNPPHVRPETDAVDSRQSGCYQLYRRGPCKAGQVMTSALREGYGRVGVCERDPCHSTSARLNNGSYALHAANNMCYRVDARGPCKVDQVFAVSQADHLPGCQAPGLSIFQLPERCKTDTADDCQVEINLNKDEKKLFAQELLMSRDRKRRRTRNAL